MHPGSERFHEILRELGELHDRKQADYGTDEDPFANVRATAQWGIPAWQGALIRLNDKVMRLKSLARNGKLYNEAAEDSMRDIAVYAIIALVLWEQEQAESTTFMPGEVIQYIPPFPKGTPVTECVLAGRPCHDHCTCRVVPA